MVSGSELLKEGTWTVRIQAKDGGTSSNVGEYKIEVLPRGGGSTGGYRITSGSGANYNGGSTLSFNTNIPSGKLSSVKINGNTLSRSNYDDSGTSTGTTITLKKSYLDSLAAGSRSISFVANDGKTADGSFSVGRIDPGYRPPARPPVSGTPSRRPVVVPQGSGGASSSGKAPTVIMKVEVEEAAVECSVMD